jgi:uncharacterized coiled-coil DUF342 family protein
MVDAENILDIYQHLQKLSEHQRTIINEIVTLRDEVKSIKRIITEGLIEDTQIRGQADRLFSAVMELQESQPNILAHQLVDRERLK